MSIKQFMANDERCVSIPHPALQMLQPFSEDVFTIHGSGWKKACKDIVLSGLGWVSITGAGDCCIKVSLLFLFPIPI